MNEKQSFTLARFAMQSEARRLLPMHRVGQCLRAIVPDRKLVEIWLSSRKNKAHYRGLRTCGCVWVCPVCASRISEERRIEIGKVRKYYESNGYTTSMCLFTMSHSRADTFAVAVTDLISCYAAFTAGKGWQNIKDAYSVHGWCRALEFTHGSNGWHPHLHVLLWHFESDADKLRMAMSDRWCKILRTIDRRGKHGVAFNLTNATKDIENYVAKFGYSPEWLPEHEIGKAVIKKAHRGHRNPAQLLSDSMAGDKQAGVLWREYAAFVAGRRQLEWSRSPSPKALAGVVELTDAEIMEKHDESAWMLAQFTSVEWSRILRVNGAGTLLDLAEKNNLFDFFMWVYDVTGKDLSKKED